MATVLLAKYIREIQASVIGAGTFITPRHILTAGHLEPDKQVKMVSGPDFLASYKKASFFDDIENIVKHPTLDLALISLKKGQTLLTPAKVCAASFAGGSYEEVLTVVQTYNLIRDERFAGSKSTVTDKDEFGIEKSPCSYICVKNRSAVGGDSGSGLYLEETEELIGVVSGGTRRLFGSDPKTYYTNITNPETKSWIEGQIR